MAAPPTGSVKFQVTDNAGETVSLTWTNAYYRVHSVQPILQTFGTPSVEHELTQEGLQLAIEGRTFRFALRDGRLEFEGGLA